MERAQGSSGGTEKMTNKMHSIHFVGIKGVGMAPLAIIAKEAGMRVSGSDVADVFITDQPLQNAGIIPLVGFSQEHIKNVDLVITTGAHDGFDNIEVLLAKRQHIPVWTQGRAVGEFMKGDIFGRSTKGVSVTGTHGKTTTTAMTATILMQAGMDPSFLIGTGAIPSLGQIGHYGAGDYFIAEADEYVSEPTHEKIPKLLLQAPTIALITNIEYDHPDVYKNVDEVIDVMRVFVEEKVKEAGIVILNGDDKNSKLLYERIRSGNKTVITFGKQAGNMYTIQNCTIAEQKTTFSLDMGENGVVHFALQSGGDHNIYNATGAIIVGLLCGLSIEQIQKGIGAFTGSKRRMEYKGKLASGAVVYDEYAHHPTEIRRSLEALRAMHPGKKIVGIFQPHTYSRTKALFTEFAQAFTEADEVILMPIYASLREKADSSVSSEDLARQIKLNGQNAIYLPRPIDVVQYLRHKNYGLHTLIVTMGAGDIYKIHDLVKSEARNPKSETKSIF